MVRTSEECTATNIEFGEALAALKMGERVRRAGWNGKGMWLSLTPGRDVPYQSFWSPRNREFAQGQPNGVAKVLPYITMKTADNSIVPWLASQTDILAEDWEVLRPFA